MSNMAWTVGLRGLRGLIGCFHTYLYSQMPKQLLHTEVLKWNVAVGRQGCVGCWGVSSLSTHTCGKGCQTAQYPGTKFGQLQLCGHIFPFNRRAIGFSGGNSEELDVWCSTVRVKTCLPALRCRNITVGFALCVLSGSQCMLGHCRILKGFCTAAWHSLLVGQEYFFDAPAAGNSCSGQEW